MNSRSGMLVQLLRREPGISAFISFGVFLFILFFQPFPLDKFDFNNRLLFDVGFGAIVFFFMVLVRMTVPRIIQKRSRNDPDPVLTSWLSSFIFLVFCSTAFVFYLRYVGSIRITFFIVFKVALICLIPPMVLKFSEIYKGLINQNESLLSERKMIQKQIEKYEADNLNKSIEFISENNNENLSLLVAEVIFIQSADNYVEIAYLNGNNVRKRMVRSTLKNIELQIKQYSNFVRCHRTCIVNTHYIEKLNHDYSSHWITLKGYDERIPVSRQYLLKIKEVF